MIGKLGLGYDHWFNGRNYTGELNESEHTTATKIVPNCRS
jgi:hypothetical protein